MPGTGTFHHLTWCLSASSHSELRPLPDSASHWEGQLWQGKEEPLGGPVESGDVWDHRAHEVEAINHRADLLHHSSKKPVLSLGQKAQDCQGRSRGSGCFWGCQRNLLPPSGQGLWDLDSAENKCPGLAL